MNRSPEASAYHQSELDTANSMKREWNSQFRPRQFPPIDIPKPLSATAVMAMITTPSVDAMINHSNWTTSIEKFLFPNKIEPSLFDGLPVFTLGYVLPIAVLTYFGEHVRKNVALMNKHNQDFKDFARSEFHGLDLG